MTNIPISICPYTNLLFVSRVPRCECLRLCLTLLGLPHISEKVTAIDSYVRIHSEFSRESMLLIDWHSHHTPPELSASLAEYNGQTPRIDSYDKTDFSVRLKELDETKIDIQLVSQGAGLEADQLPKTQAIELCRRSNAILAERIGSHSDRFFGVIALSFKNIPESVVEIERMASRGFRAVLLYPTVDGKFILDQPIADPVFAKISELKLGVFLHGIASSNDPSLDRLEDQGAGVAYSVIADARVSECVVRMIASGLFDRFPALKIVIRSGGGGLPLLLHRLFWKHKGPEGEKRYAEIFLEHFLVDTAGVSPHAFRFLIDTLGEANIVFGSDYCGGLGPLIHGLRVLDEQPDPAAARRLSEKNSRRLLGI